MENNKPLPIKKENPNGLHARYYIQKIVGLKVTGEDFFGSPERDYVLEQVDEKSEYFVLRLDDKGSDPKHIKACKQAAIHYAIKIRDHLPELSKDLIERYSDNNTVIKKVGELIKSKDCPLPLEVIPNQMGINLCSVDSISWEKQDDGQLVDLTIHFSPQYLTGKLKKS